MKTQLKTYQTLLLLCFFICSNGQVIDNTSSFRQLPSKEYIRFHYDNDFFTATDYYYTQGITIEYASRRKQRNPVDRILFNPIDADALYGYTFNLFGYTPTSIKSDVILEGDRPFAAAITIKRFISWNDNVRRLHVTSAIILGVMGPAALGRQIQTNIHRWTGNKIPKGWQYQVRNAPVINYQLNIEKDIIKKRGIADAHFIGELRLGTMENKLSTGINFMLGILPGNSGTTKQKNRIQAYIYGQGRINVVGYDATMEGGLFSGNNPYTIHSSNISRITFQANAGVALILSKISISYSQAYLTREFTSGRTHRWGGLTMGIVL